MTKRSPVFSTSVRVTIRLQEFRIPPVHDCLVIGRKSPIGCVAMKKALSLMHTATFTDLHPDDEIIADILIRSSILKKLPPEDLVRLILKRVKPLMNIDEVIRLDIDPEVLIEDQL